MTDEEQGQFYDVVYEMRGFAATLLAASRGDLQEPDKIIEYAAYRKSSISLIASSSASRDKRIETETRTTNAM